MYLSILHLPIVELRRVAKSRKSHRVTEPITILPIIRYKKRFYNIAQISLQRLASSKPTQV